MLTAGMYSSLVNNNIPTAIGCAIMRDAFTENNDNNRESKNKKPTNYPKRVKHTRTHNIPEDSKRCTAITKKGEQCMCVRLQESNYCVTHNKKFKPRQIQEQTIQEEPIRKTWKNLYGLLK